MPEAEQVDGSGGGSGGGGGVGGLPGGGGPRRPRVEINLSESTDQVALGYLKKYGRKLAVEWPLQGLKFSALALLAAGAHHFYFFFFSFFAKKCDVIFIRISNF